MIMYLSRIESSVLPTKKNFYLSAQPFRPPPARFCPKDHQKTRIRFGRGIIIIFTGLGKELKRGSEVPSPTRILFHFPHNRWLSWPWCLLAPPSPFHFQPARNQRAQTKNWDWPRGKKKKKKKKKKKESE